MRGFGFGQQHHRKPPSGGTPTPTPGVTPLVSSDFKNDVYAIGGVSKTLADVWTENLTAWGSWDTSRVVPGTGLIAGQNGGPFSSAAMEAALFPGGYVCVMKGILADGGDLFVDASDFPAETVDTILSVTTSGGNQAAAFTGGDTPNWLEISLGAFKAAFLVNGTALAFSANGSANNTAARTLNADTGLAIGFNTGPETVLESITFYSLSDYTAADLPALST